MVWVQGGETPLHKAARGGHAEITGSLLGVQADPNVATAVTAAAPRMAAGVRPLQEGQTALHMAAQAGEADTIKHLIKSKARQDCAMVDIYT